MIFILDFLICPQLINFRTVMMPKRAISISTAKSSFALSLSTVLIPQRERINYIQTQMEIITSKRVARKVVEDLKLAESPASRAGFEEDTRRPLSHDTVYHPNL